MTAHYAPGRWTAAVDGDRLVIGSDADWVLAQWAALLAGEDLVPALVHRAAAPMDFVLIDRSGTDLIVLVRGELPVVADLGGEELVTIDARGLRTWAERRFPAAARITVGTPTGESPLWPVRSGLVAVSCLVVAPTGVPPTEVRSTVVPAAGVRPAQPPRPAALVSGVPTVLPAGSTIAPAAVTPPAVASPAKGKDTLVGPAETDLEHLFEHTISRPVEAAAVRAEAAGTDLAGPDRPVAGAARPGVGALGDHDGTTITAAALAEIAGQRADGRDRADSPTGSGTGARPGTSEPTYLIGQEVTVVLSTGRELPLSGPVVIGRQPRVDRWSGPVAPTLVTVAAGRESDISRTHLRIERVEGRVVVTDLNAANGSVVIRPDGESDLRDGASAVLTAEDVVDIGDDVVVSIRVGR